MILNYHKELNKLVVPKSVVTFHMNFIYSRNGQGKAWCIYIVSTFVDINISICSILLIKNAQICYYIN